MMTGQKSNSVSIDDYLWLNRYQLELFGIWSMDSKGRTLVSRLFIIFRVCFAVVAIGAILVPEVLKIIIYWGDLNVLTGIGCIATPITLLLFKISYMVIRNNEFDRFYSNLTRLWSAIDDDNEFQPLEKLASFSKLVTIWFLVSCLSNIVTFTSAAVVDWVNDDDVRNDSTPRHLPFDVWFSFDMESSPNFEIAFGCQIISSFYCGVGVSGIDATMLTFILHICGHFRTISVKLQTISDSILDNEKHCNIDVQSMVIKKDINQVFKQHSEMLRIAEQMRTLLAPIIFMQLLTSALDLCLIIYALTMIDNDQANIVNFIFFFITIFMQLVMWCWPGQLLQDDSAALSYDICYELPWHLLSTAEQRDIAFFIMRTQKQCQITALDFQVMSMNKFTEVFNSAGSYFALLRTIHNKQLEAQRGGN